MSHWLLDDYFTWKIIEQELGHMEPEERDKVVGLLEESVKTDAGKALAQMVRQVRDELNGSQV